VLLAFVLTAVAGCSLEVPSAMCMKKGWGYEVRIEADRAGEDDLKKIIYLLTSSGFAVDWHDRVVELRYKGEVNTALYKDLDTGDHPFINVMIYYVGSTADDSVNYPKIDIGNPYRGSSSPSIKAEIDAYGDMVMRELATSSGSVNVKIRRNLMDPPLCL